MQRRHFFWSVLASLLTARLPITKARALTWPEEPAPFTLLDLPYPTSALEPYIDNLTMRVQYDCIIRLTCTTLIML